MISTLVRFENQRYSRLVDTEPFNIKEYGRRTALLIDTLPKRVRTTRPSVKGVSITRLMKRYSTIEGKDQGNS